MAEFKYYGIPRIYTERECNKYTVVDIYKETKVEGHAICDHINKLTEIYKGNQEEYIPDSDRKANEKNVVNYIKVFLDTVVSILFHKPITYISRNLEKDYLEDVDKIVAYLSDEGETDLNISTGTDMVVNGIGYQYVIQQSKKDDPTPNSPFTIGRLDNSKTYSVNTSKIGNKVEVVFNFYTTTDENGNIIEKITAYDDKNIYFIQKSLNDTDYVLSKIEYFDYATGKTLELDYLQHNFPSNPIQVYENDMYRLNSVQDMWGLQKALNLAISSYNNDMMLKINQLLAIFGIDLTEEDKENIKEKNILVSPKENAKIQFIASQLDSRAVDYINNTIERLNTISGAPSQGGSRAETGVASQTENGYTIASFNSNRKEQRFIQPKKRQLSNVITILRRNGMLKSKITPNDIEIKFDRNRLSSITEHVKNLQTLINTGVKPIDALKVIPLFEDNGQVSNGIEETLKKRENSNLKLNTIDDNQTKSENI